MAGGCRSVAGTNSHKERRVLTCVAAVAPRMACSFASSSLGIHTMALGILFDLMIL